MQRQDPSVIFDQKHASEYDKRFAKLAPLRDALHLLISAVLADLPAEARILLKKLRATYTAARSLFPSVAHTTSALPVSGRAHSRPVASWQPD